MNKLLNKFKEEIKDYYIKDSEDLFKNEIVKEMEGEELFKLLLKEDYNVEVFVNGIEIRKTKYDTIYGSIFHKGKDILVLDK